MRMFLKQDIELSVKYTTTSLFLGNRVSLFVFIILFACSCQESGVNKKIVKSQDGYLIHPVSPENTVVLSSNQLSDLKFIPLEATDNSYVTDIAKLERDTTTGFWYILDRNNPSVICVFNGEGKFIKNIKYLGRGPGEYQRINDFYISDGNWIEFLEGETQKIIRYDLKNDSLITEKKIPFYAYNYSYLENGNYVFYKNSQAKNQEDEKYFYRLLVTDTDFNLIRTGLPFELELGVNISIMNPNALTRTSGGLTFNQFNADTLYSIYEDTIKINHVLDFGDYVVPDPDDMEFSSGSEKLRYYFSKTDKHIIGVHQIKETKDFFSFNFIYNDDAFLYMYDKTSNDYFVASRIDFNDKNVFFPPPVNYLDSTFISIYTVDMLNEKVSIDNLDINNQYEKSLAYGIEYQNPVLVTYKINPNQ